MDQEDLLKKQRKAFSTGNVYQEKIIFLTFFPSVFISLVFISIVFICNPIVSELVLHTTYPALERLVNQFSGLIVFLTCSVFFYSLVLAFRISNQMVGAFGRINRELDDIIAGKSNKAITCRPNDQMTKELLKRVNVLVEHYLKDKYDNTNS